MGPVPLLEGHEKQRLRRLGLDLPDELGDGSLLIERVSFRRDADAQLRLERLEFAHILPLATLGVEARAGPAIVARLAQGLGRRIDERGADDGGLLGRSRRLGQRQAAEPVMRAQGQGRRGPTHGLQEHASGESSSSV